ncbi:RING and UBP finger domain protein [Zymoseptoria brevis]|uniref:RING and UBP finger domain protein n=1 Tax=Zymoseptoria brevis TaxID=1047168 RepID=A0A0F4G8T9_9PEZI|nr:RING and UBP finger domain protein [Zymoseptoria brevis]
MPPVAVGFHLKFELYPTPANTSSGANTSSEAYLATEHDCFLPPPGTDIFKADLPAHQVRIWKRSEEKVEDKETGRDNFGAIGTHGWKQKDHLGAKDKKLSSLHLSLPLAPPRPRTPELKSSSHGDALLLPERSLNLRRDVFPSTPPRRAVLSNAAAASDWRYGKVEIESIDMESINGKAKSGVGGNGGGPLVQTKAVYRPSDPKTTDMGWGVVHLYRGEEESAGLEGGTNFTDGEEFKLEDCTTLCILAVPSWMMPSDLLGFVGDQAREEISHFRLIRTGRANKYLVLMKFRSAKRAREWQKAYNGRLFSSAEPENCHVVFIKSVEFATGEDDVNGSVADKSSANFPHNTHDPFTTVTTSNRSNKSLSSTTKPLAPPPPNLLELPTCPVCLERMDETTGLLTILCQHVFHCACLEKWRGSGCPVCRYTHSPSYTFPFPRPDSSTDLTHSDPAPLCSTCGQENNLWICLICGNIGCGRYDSAHAFAHYESTSHCYAMDINTQHVWDYAGDGYVHRLIQSKPTPDSTTSATLPLASRRHENEAFRSEPSDSVPREKMESMAAEYTYLLTSQLEGQRRYFEEQVERAMLKSHAASALAEKAAASAAAAQTAAETAIAERGEMEQVLSQVRKGAEKAEAARAKFEALARGLGKQVQEEKVVSEGLMERVKTLQGQVEGLKVEVEKEKLAKAECEELNKDLTAYIEGAEKVRMLEEAGEEIGEVGVVKGKGKGRRKKK